MATGILRIQTFAAQRSAPMPRVTVTVTGDDFTKTLVTDAEGRAEDILIETPACRYSLEEGNTTVQPYATCALEAHKEGYGRVEIRGSQIFPNQVTLAWLELIPAAGELSRIADEEVEIPAHPLFTGEGGSGPAPAQQSERILGEVVIPSRITVHLGKPAAAARNVTVSFRDYIANVASSEVYPTWPEQALRANIHAQISLAVNRIYTEWYPSRGYSFNITNSTSYDQNYVHGRTVFDVMVKLTDDIFNTYVRKAGTMNPYYTEYCDGKSVSCPGMKQWGTVTQANNGKNALQILRYYYGNSVEVVRTSNIRAIPGSYPGSPVRQGDRGANVYTLQRQLDRIAKDYPFFGSLTADGVFGSGMAAVVKRFQSWFGLTADGVVGRQTWYKISYIYASVKRLAELTSEGETVSGSLSDGSYPGTALRSGSSGTAVQQLQYWLNVIAQYYASIPAVAVDGSFGSGTARAVRAFQTKFGLAADGVAGRATWNAIYREYTSIQSDITSGVNQYPGAPLRQGATGGNVKLVQFWLRMAKTLYPALENTTVDGSFGSGTAQAVRRFQSYFGLTADGVVGRSTWYKLREVYNGVANQLLDASLRPGEFPGTLRSGSSGKAVRELQYYLYVVSAYERSMPKVSIDGQFGSGTEAAVRAFQRLQGLTADGVVGRATWNALYQRASRLRDSGPVITITRRAYPGAPLRLGDTGEDVLYYTLLVERIAFYYDSVQSPGASEVYDEAAANATGGLQALLGLGRTGVVDAVTWAAAEALSLSLLASEISGEEASGDYPGSALAEGSAGPAVRRLQKALNARARVDENAPFVPEDGIYTGALADCVAALQRENDYSPNGVTCRQTWELIAGRSEGGCDCGEGAGV